MSGADDDQSIATARRETMASLGCLVLIVAWGSFGALAIAYWLITGQPLVASDALRKRANQSYEEQVANLSS